MRSHQMLYAGLVFMLVWLLALPAAVAQNTAFTYQGLLKSEGLPSNGAFDFQFKLFDAETEGTQIGSTLTITGAQVTNGLFGASLDFGLSAFTGSPRWLEIAAKMPADTEYTTLTPRVSLTPVPYSIYAYTANAIKLQGRPIDLTEPTLNQVLQWDGVMWKPASVVVYTAGAGLTLSEDNVFSIADNGVVTNMIADNAVTNPKLADNAVSTSKIQDNAVTEPKLADNAVSTNKIQDNAVTNPKLADNAVSTSKIQDNAVTNPKLADNSVSTSKIQDNAVTTAKIADSAVTTPKIGDGAVTTAKIADNAVTTPKIADNSISTAKLQNNSVTTAKINPAGALVGQSLTWNGANVVWAFPVASGLLLPFVGAANTAAPNPVFSISNTGTGFGILGTAVAANASGVHGQNDIATGAGVSGHSANGIGTNGFSLNNIGVAGKAGGGANPALPAGTGVLGISTLAGGEGVRGVSTAANATGVRGIADAGANAIGVNGTSATGTGVSGTSTAAGGDGVLGTGGNNGNGVRGVANLGGAGAFGVLGTSTVGSGVVGRAGAALAAPPALTGVYGTTDNAGSDAILGDAKGANGNGVRGIADVGGAGAFGVLGTSTVGSGVVGRAGAAAAVPPALTGVFGTSDNGGSDGVRGLATGAAGNGVYGIANVANGNGVFGEASNNAGSFGVLGITTTGAGVVGRAGAGILAVPPALTGVYGLSNNPTSAGVHGVNNVAGGFGILGQSTNGVGVVARANGAGDAPIDRTAVFGVTSAAGRAIGLHGLVTGNNGHGVRGVANVGVQAWGVVGSSSTGTGVVGLRGLDPTAANSPAGTGVFGATNADDAAGVRGSASGANGRGVFGDATGAGANSFGVMGLSTNGTGVVGSTGAALVGAPTNRSGVFGITNLNAGYGVLGVHTVAGRDAVFAAGNLGAAGAKTFRIDHPMDPANKYLLHYCSEGPEPLNVYRGNVVLDAKGEAWVQLPAYFESINRDWSYTLTAIGGAAPNLHVRQEVSNNRFLIAGGMPGMKVSWRVEAVRNDLYMQHYGAPVEVDKPREERGRFQFPELYGMPRERGIFFVPLVEPDNQ